MRQEGPITLTTARLRLRRWRPEDLPPYAAMNADPRVREYFPKVLTAEAGIHGVELSMVERVESVDVEG